MKWVTRDNVHLDRVASPWLITRFIDPDAEFVFIDPDVAECPVDTVPFALPGVELGMHDHDGTTFDKIMDKFEVSAPELSDIGDVVRAAVRHVLGEPQDGAPGAVVHHGIALAMISEGIMIRRTDDHAILAASYEVYDALFAYFWSRRVDPRTGKDTFWTRMESLRAQWIEHRPSSFRGAGTV